VRARSTGRGAKFRQNDRQKFVDGGKERRFEAAVALYRAMGMRAALGGAERLLD